jgi:predicted enzyme related to lactoylglutathione lyase
MIKQENNISNGVKKNNLVRWVEIPVMEMDRAKKFYEALLDTTLTERKMDDYEMMVFPMDMEAPGGGAGLIKDKDYKPSKTGTIVYFSTADIDKSLKMAEANGGKIAVNKTDMGEHGFYAQIQDSEGNTVGLIMRRR